MTCIRDVYEPEGLEREFDRIRKVFSGLKWEELPLRIEWGTKAAFLASSVQQLLEAAASLKEGNLHAT